MWVAIRDGPWADGRNTDLAPGDGFSVCHRRTMVLEDLPTKLGHLWGKCLVNLPAPWFAYDDCSIWDHMEIFGDFMRIYGMIYGFSMVFLNWKIPKSLLVSIRSHGLMTWKEPLKS